MMRGRVCQNPTHLDESIKILTLKRWIKCGRLQILYETRRKFLLIVKI